MADWAGVTVPVAAHVVSQMVDAPIPALAGGRKHGRVLTDGEVLDVLDDFARSSYRRRREAARQVRYRPGGQRLGSKRPVASATMCMPLRLVMTWVKQAAPWSRKMSSSITLSANCCYD